MKKVILSAFCLTVLGLTSVNAVTENKSIVVVASFEDGGRKVIKSEELPEAIQKTLASDAYKGWAVKEAALVSAATSAPSDQAKTAETAALSHYEVVLSNEKETQTVKFSADGALLK